MQKFWNNKMFNKFQGWVTLLLVRHWFAISVMGKVTLFYSFFSTILWFTFRGGLQKKEAYIFQLNKVYSLVVWKGIHFKSDTNRNWAKCLSFYHLRLLYCPDQMLAVLLLSQHQASSIKTIRPCAPCGA